MTETAVGTAERETGNGSGGEADASTVLYRHFTSTKTPQTRERDYALKMPTCGELLASDFKHRQYLLSPWLREQQSSMIYAASGIGKSLFALSTALAVAGGGEFLGWSPEPKTNGAAWRVLYVDGEMHISDIQERVRQLRGGIPNLDVTKVDENLIFLARQHQDGGVQFPSITEAAGQKFIVGQIEGRQLDLVVLDNFSTLGEVEDENAAASFNAIQTFLLNLKGHEVATILVHHTGKAEDNFRGSSKLAATFETIIQLERPRTFYHRTPSGGLRVAREDMTDSGVARFRVRWDKVRTGSRELRPVVATLVNSGFGKDERGEYLAAKWEWEAGALRTLDEMREQLEAGAFTSQKEIADYFGVSPTTARNWINQGALLGLWAEDHISRWIAIGKKKRDKGNTEPPVPPDDSWKAELTHPIGAMDF
jgi:AAA domain